MVVKLNKVLHLVRNSVKVGDSLQALEWQYFYFPCYPERSEGSHFLMFSEKKKSRFFAGCRMTPLIFGTVSIAPCSFLIIPRT